MSSLVSLHRALARYFLAFLVLALGGGAALFVGPALAGGPYLKLVETVVDPSGWMFPTIADGHIFQKDPDYGNYEADYTWSPPPQTMDGNGASMSLSVKATAKSSINAGIGVSGSSFEFVDGVKGTDTVSVRDGKSGSASKTVRFKPLTHLSPGSIVELKVGVYFYGGVTYRYQVSDTELPGADRDDKTTTDDPGGRLAVRVDCPTEITIGRLPSLNCHLLISNYRRNTASPVQVIVPSSIDSYGNTASGIQLTQLEGAQDVFNWPDEYSWGFFVYACQAPNIGANCYDNVASPGPASIPVTIRQEGRGEVTIVLVFNVRPASTAIVVTPSNAQYRLGNRWRPGHFLHLEYGPPLGGMILIEWLSARWTLEPLREGAAEVRIRNVWKPDIYLHVENGILEAGPIRPEWLSALWLLEDVSTGDGQFYNIHNYWKPEMYLNLEAGGQVTARELHSDWTSEQWWFLK